MKELKVIQKNTKRSLIIKNWLEPDMIIPINFQYSWKDIRWTLKNYYKKEVWRPVIKCLRGEVLDVSNWSNDQKCYILNCSTISNLEGVAKVGLTYQHPKNPNNFFIDVIELKEGFRELTPNEWRQIHESKKYSF